MYNTHVIQHLPSACPSPLNGGRAMLSRFRCAAVCFALIFLSVGTAAAQTGFDRARMDSLFDVLERNDRMMGAVTVRKGGRVIYQRSLGLRDVAARAPADAETMFRV